MGWLSSKEGCRPEELSLFVSKGLMVDGCRWVQQAVDVDIAEGRWRVLLTKGMMSLKQRLTVVAIQCGVEKERKGGGERGFYTRFLPRLGSFADTGA
jgi:hypothetical protein